MTTESRDGTGGPGEARRTLQNEDSDVSTAVAYEKDAPCKRYLNALYAKLKAL